MREGGREREREGEGEGEKGTGRESGRGDRGRERGNGKGTYMQFIDSTASRDVMANIHVCSISHAVPENWEWTYTPMGPIPGPPPPWGIQNVL